MQDPTPKRYTDTLAPAAVSDELLPVIEGLGLLDNCRELADRGWTVVENVGTAEFTAALRSTILRLSSKGGANMLLSKDLSLIHI